MKKLISYIFTIVFMFLFAVVPCAGAEDALTASAKTGDAGKVALIIVCVVAFAGAIFVFTRRKPTK